jgi:lipid-binding SYLF domain-containing protein
MIMIRLLTAIVASCGMLTFGAVSPSHAQSTGSVRIEIVSAGFILGVESGRGTLTFRGRQYPLRISGISAGATIGLSKTELIGTASGLRNVSDIEGTYTAGSASLAIAGGRRTAQLRNSRGVVMNLRGRQVGFEFSLDLSGMQVALR